jgi:hypothetical protein
MHKSVQPFLHNQLLVKIHGPASGESGQLEKSSSFNSKLSRTFGPWYSGGCIERAQVSGLNHKTTCKGLYDVNKCRYTSQDGLESI